jgi:D-amino-acid dehydrogenase
MRIAVLGAGVIGVTSAYYLRRAGHQVTVIDRCGRPGLETSYANAGQISWGYAGPWAAPGIPLKAFKWAFQAHAPLVVRPRLDPDLFRWLWAMLKECSADRYHLNKGRMLLIAQYSHHCLIELRQRLGLSYDQQSLGTLQVMRTPKALSQSAADVRLLQQFKIPHELLDQAGCLAAEPALALVGQKIAGGLRLPGDETGDCYTFTSALAEHCRAQEVEFLLGREVASLRTSRKRIEAAMFVDGTGFQADHFVVAAGSYSVPLLASAGVRVPVYPVKGYSSTVRITDPSAAPRSTVMDEAYKVAVTRLGCRIRAAGTAELAGFDRRLNPKRCATIDHVLRDLFPCAADISKAAHWTGLRPMTPDGTPVVGATLFPNLFVNTGHGTLGWTMACGSGKLIADIIGGADTKIAGAPFALARYGAPAEKIDRLQMADVAA